MVDYWSSAHIRTYFMTKEPNHFLCNMVIGSKKKTSYDHVLDIGCGYGRNILPFIGKSSRIYAFDLCKEAVEFTKQRYSTVDFLVVREQNLIDFPETDLRFDFIVSDGVFHQLDFVNFHNTLFYLRNLMVPGSILFLSLFTNDQWPIDCFQISDYEFKNNEGISMTLLSSENILKLLIEKGIVPFFIKREIFNLPVGIRSNLTLGANIV